jgi:hypothetical protein
MKMMMYAVVLFAAVGGAVHAQPAAGLFGQSLADAQKSGFFTWFNLAQTASQACGGGRALGFRPTGEQFHRLAAVEVVTDAHGAIAAMTLTLDRAFIEDPANGVFARDIAKSFLFDVPGSPTDANVAALAEEIEAGAPSGTVVYRTDAAPPKPEGPPSPGYQVFLGRRASYQLIAGGEALDMINEQQDGQPVLRQSFSRAGVATACPMGEIAD